MKAMFVGRYLDFRLGRGRRKVCFLVIIFFIGFVEFVGCFSIGFLWEDMVVVIEGGWYWNLGYIYGE